jgi:hypothetical protein
MKGYGKLILALVSAWFLFAISASALGLFKSALGGVGIAVGLFAFVPLVIFFIWFSASREFREYVLSANPQTLTFAQSWRVVGLVFVVLEAHHRLPAIFAWPAGYGDIFIGVTAAAVAFKLATPEHRGLFILWQALGIFDLVSAVALGTTARLFDQVTTMDPMTVLPLSLIPTFFVPLFLMIHVINIAQARRWPATSSATRVSGALIQAH